MSAEVICGDCLEVMPSLGAESFDAIVCDPPYGLKFMGKSWDHGVPSVPFWTEALRVAKAGSYLLAFGGTRTYHRLACAIEDAGWEIQDCLSWLYGSGFPKHKSKLKPAWEPVVMARKKAPKATLLNIDACRIEGVPPSVPQPRFNSASGLVYGFKSGEGRNGEMSQASGRWPANVLLDEEAAAVLDEQSGITSSKTGGISTPSPTFRQANAVIARRGHDDSGGVSRFFYTAKASRSERETGLEGFGLRVSGSLTGSGAGDGSLKTGSGNERNTHVRNNHPTVKPVEIMRWLCRLVTPQGGIILDPFAGSGTTGVAATLEGFRFVGIEKEPEYAEIARKRITETPPSLFGEVA